MSLIAHSKPTLPEGEEWEEVTSLLAPGWAADGPCTRRFEGDVAGWLGCAEAAAVNSGTNALQLALLAVGAGPGTEVLVPAYCCAALLNAVASSGATPILVDSELGGFNLCPEDAARRTTQRTAAIVAAHMFGTPARTEALLAIGPPVIEDCAQALGARDQGAIVGSRGALAIGSFYATKVITTGHGGAVATSDPDLVAVIRDLTHYDNRDDWRPRFNYGIGESAAALGLWQLERLPAFLGIRREIADFYDGALGAAGSRAESGDIPYRYTVRAADAESAIEVLREQGIDAKRPVYRPLHHYLGGDYPHAQAAHEQIVSLPIYPVLADGEVERVADALGSLKTALKHGI